MNPRTSHRPIIRPLQIVAAPSQSDKIGVNGPEKRALSILPFWSALGVEPIVLYPRRGRLWEAFTNSGATLSDFEVSNKFDFRAIQRIAANVKKFQASLIHTQGPGSIDGLAAIAALIAKVPLVVTRPVMIEDLVNRSPFRRQLYAKVDRITLEMATLVTAVSEDGRNHLQTIAGVDTSRLRLIPNGVDVEKFTPVTRLDRVHNHSIRVGMVAQLTAPKGWEDFLQVIETLSKEDSRVEGHIIGDGPMNKQLREVATKRRIPIQFRGHIPNVQEILPEFDIFLFTSHREGMPMAILEAMACGLPIVATDVGGTRELIEHDVTGMLRSAGDLNGLANDVRRLIASKVFADQLGQAARKRAESNFSIAAMARGYATAYQQTLLPLGEEGHGNER